MAKPETEPSETLNSPSYQTPWVIKADVFPTTAPNNSVGLGWGPGRGLKETPDDC